MTIRRNDQPDVAAPIATNGRPKHRTRVFLTAAVLGAYTAAGCSSTTAKQTMKVLEVDTSFSGTGGFDANGRTPPDVGQGVVIDGALYQPAGDQQGPRLGGLHIECVFTSSSGASFCTAVLSLPTDKLVVSGKTPADSAKAYTLPIVGGSGRYANVKGQVTIKPNGNSNNAVDTIVFG